MEEQGLPSRNPFYTNKDLDEIDPKTIQVGRIVSLCRELRDFEADKSRNLLWQRSQWLIDGIPVVLKDCKIERSGPDGEFVLTAKGKIDAERLKSTIPKEKQDELSGFPNITGQVVIYPSAETLDEQIISNITPFYVVRGGVEALQIALGIPPPWEERKETMYLEKLRAQGLDLHSPRDFD